jgi:hypothetical protein
LIVLVLVLLLALTLKLDELLQSLDLRPWEVALAAIYARRGSGCSRAIDT